MIEASNRIVLEKVDCELCGSHESRELFLATDHFSESKDQYALVQCMNCSLIYVSPRPTAETIYLCYPDAYYDTHVSHVKDVQHGLIQVELRRIRDIQRFVTRGRILDIGCGNGRFLSVAKEAGWNTLGIEISADMAEIARRDYGLEVIEGGFLDLELPAECFDVVTMWGVLEHLHHPKGALNKVYKLLRPGGLFVVLTPNVDSTQFRLFGPNWSLLDVPRHLYQFSRTTLRRIVEDAGFKQVWGRYYAPEHDLGNLITSLEITLFGEGRCLRSYRRWGIRRIAMGVLRRLAPVIARTMAGWKHSAAMELYFVKV
jgi:2-polyprenyl-3-methyl-5-hydroxy-6-metoxy-1,4-benzoquinol methylase